MLARVVTLPQGQDTAYVPLAVLGYCLNRTKFLAPLSTVNLNMKTVRHAPAAKLQAIRVSILANGTSIKQVDLKMRSDLVLAEAWGAVPRFPSKASPRPRESMSSSPLIGCQSAIRHQDTGRSCSAARKGSR